MAKQPSNRITCDKDRYVAVKVTNRDATNPKGKIKELIKELKPPKLKEKS